MFIIKKVKNMNKNKRIIIIYGGYSEEKDVSLITGIEIGKALLSSNYEVHYLDPAEKNSYLNVIKEIKELSPFIVFNALHGADGENGRLQALFDLHHIPYTGSGFRSSAISMDKYLSGEIVKAMNLPVPEKILIKDNYQLDKIICSCSFPLVIKPNDTGSSVGITIIENETGLEEAFNNAKKYSNEILLEEYIFGRELTVTILDKEPLPVVEIIPQNGWYNYMNKYTKGNTIYQIPAKLTEKETKQIQQYALDIYNEFGCESYSRIDFRYDLEQFYFLEVNTLPGMTPLSLTPMAAKEAGISFEKLLEIIIQTSFKKFEKREEIWKRRKN